VIVVLVDCTKIHESLILPFQLLEIGVNPILVLNFADQLEEFGIELNIPTLQEKLGVPCIPFISPLSRGREKILEMIVHHPFRQKRKSRQGLGIPEVWAKAVEEILSLEGKNPKEAAPLERISAIGKLVEGKVNDPRIASIRASLIPTGKTVGSDFVFPPELGRIFETDRRQRIDELLQACGMKKGDSPSRITEKIDRVVLSSFWKFPIFFSIVALIFWTTFFVGDFPGELIRRGVTALRTFLLVRFPQSLLIDLLGNGIIPGVGGVLTFLPNIAILFFWLTFLEESGYLARVALIMDGLMKYLDLEGRAFIPIVTGLGCNTPAIMATKILPSRTQRLKLMLLIPLLGCSARLPVLVLFSGVFFPAHPGIVLFLLYLLNFLLLVALLFGFKILGPVKSSSEKPLELPVYRVPLMERLSSILWDRLQHFAEKA